MADINILSPDICCGNKNLLPDKMSGRSKVLPDKTDFLIFQAGVEKIDEHRS